METRRVCQKSETHSSHLLDSKTSKALRSRDPNVPLSRHSHDKESRHAFPIPKGDTPYSKAKRFEYVDKDLTKAAHFYQLAINQGDRPESAVKDLAGVLHQQGNTSLACETLEKYKHLFKAEPSKFENLLQNLKKQVPTCALACKFLKVTGLRDSDTPSNLRRLFKNPNRIHSLTLKGTGEERHALLQFSTHSAARKSIDSFSAKEGYRIEWVVGGKGEDERSPRPGFSAALFEMEEGLGGFPAPLDEGSWNVTVCVYEDDHTEEAKTEGELLGLELLSALNLN